MRHKKSIPNRSFRVADQIQRDLAELDPRAEGSAHRHGHDQQRRGHARLRPRQGAASRCWSATPQDCEPALNEAAGFLRNGLFKRLPIHTVPTLHFQFDRTTERAADLSALITRANATRAKDD